MIFIFINNSLHINFYQMKVLNLPKPQITTIIIVIPTKNSIKGYFHYPVQIDKSFMVHPV